MFGALLDDLAERGTRLGPDDVMWVIGEADLIWSHRGADKPVCSAYIGPPRTGHTIDAGGPDDLERLTIGGSLLCPTCQRHGHVRDGKWSSA